MTVVCQGLTAGLVANWLRITSKEATGAVIVGCNPLSLLIARFFQEREETVVMIDTDPERCEQAEAQNLRVIASSALDVTVLEEAGLDSIGTFLAMTNNGEVNFVLAQRAAEEFSPPRVLAVFPRDPQANPSSNNKVHQAFATDVTIKTWNEYLNDGRVKLGTTTLSEPELSQQQDRIQEKIRTGELIPLLIERKERLQVIPVNQKWEAGDRIIYLLHDPRPNLLKRLSGGNQSTRLALEKLPEVEEVPLDKLSELFTSDTPGS